MLARLILALLIFVSTAAQAQEGPASLNITTRSSGSMFASYIAQHELGLPDGRFQYELVFTSTVERARIDWHNPLWFRALGTGSVTLIVGGTSHTFRDFDNWLGMSAQFYSSFPYEPRTETFQHDATIGSYYGIGLTGYQRMSWPEGGFPGTQAFFEQSWVFDGPAVGEVYFNLEMGGERVGYFMGTADHAEMSISAVPEPGQVVLLLAGLGLVGMTRRSTSTRSSCCWPTT